MKDKQNVAASAELKEQRKKELEAQKAERAKKAAELREKRKAEAEKRKQDAVGKSRPQDFKGALVAILKYLRPWYAAIIISLILSLSGTVISLVAPGLMANLTNLIQEGLKGDFDFGAVKNAIYVIFALYLVGGLISTASSYVMITVMQKFAYSMRNDITSKINRLPLRFFDKMSTGDIMSRITNDVDTLSSTINSSITSMIQAVLQFVGVVIIMFATNVKLTLTAIGSTVLGFVLMFVIVAISRKYFQQQQKNLGEMNGHVEEMFSGHDIVRVYSGVGEATREFDRINNNLYETSWKSQVYGGMLSPIMSFSGSIGYVAVCVVGAALALEGKIPFGTIVAFIAYVRLFSGPLTQVASVTTNLLSATAAGERIFGFLGEEELSDESGAGEKPADVRGNVEFDHVCFGYDESKTVIHDFSASVKAGQKIAIVGHTGAGKTTMVNLLMRFYELWGGEIRIDGTPIASLRRSDVHSMFGMVLQDTWLFEGSYFENIAYNNKDVTLEQVREACRAVGLDHFIMTLPEQYDTQINDRSSLSAGQRQLLTIARAMVENAPMIILDEATSSVDTRTERLVQEAMYKLTQGRTSFVIAHRLSTIRDADLILVMDKGDIVESGTHEELLRKGGLYGELYYSQFEMKEEA